MSKYTRGAYHYDEFAKDTPYRAHVLDLIEQVAQRVAIFGSIAEVGAGEGLILDQLESLEFTCSGCDTDPTAVMLSKQKNGLVEHGSIEVFAGKTFDAVLLCDMLEHVQDPIAMMAAARKIAPLIFIAIPDRDDRHAINKVDPAVVKSCMDVDGWRCVHQSQRHARHLLIFEKSS